MKSKIKILIKGIALLGMFGLLLSCGGGGGGGTPDLPPNTPQNFMAVATNDNILLSWDKSDKAISYKLYWNTVGGVSTSDSFFQVTSLNHEHKPILSGTTYYYGITATNDSGESNMSPIISIISIPINSITAYYPFNGNANDESGNNNSGTVHGAVLTSDRFGNANSAYYFDGVNDYISFGVVTPLANHSMSVWIQPQLQAQFGTIVGHEAGPSAACNKGFRLGVNSLLTPSYSLDLAACGTADTIVLDNSTILDENTWSHLAATYDGDTASLYVNGNLVDQKTGAVFDASNWLALGATTFFNGQQVHYKGAIDDVRIYFSVLSDQEVQALFNEKKSISP